MRGNDESLRLLDQMGQVLNLSTNCFPSLSPVTTGHGRTAQILLLQVLLGLTVVSELTEGGKVPHTLNPLLLGESLDLTQAICMHRRKMRLVVPCKVVLSGNTCTHMYVHPKVGNTLYRLVQADADCAPNALRSVIMVPSRQRLRRHLHAARS